MINFLAALTLQAAALPPDTWKERNHPDMPIVSACKIGHETPVSKFSKLPVAVRVELNRFFGPVGGLSEADGPFNSSDVVNGKVPSRRFIKAYHLGNAWVIWYERGGFFHNLQTIELASQANDRDKGNTLRVQPATTFIGDLCTATKAIVGGVRTGTP